MIFVLVPAAGAGTRMQAVSEGQRKQYRMLGGQTILDRTLMRLASFAAVDLIVCIVPADDMPPPIATKKDRLGLRSAEIHYVAGGESRTESVRNGLRYLRERFPAQAEDLVAIHDGVRPFVSETLFARLLDVAREQGAAIPFLPITDTIKAVGTDGRMKAHLDRSEMVAVQTPQIFARSLIEEAYAKADAEARAESRENKKVRDRHEMQITDDSSLLPAESLRLVPGEKQNIKITTMEDLRYAEFLISLEGSI
ncbi:MAG: IspD/TarI family cytidylyltransferase [Bacillota bacterium]|nr:IspD/TarI family cytidylyltransferase [Bacillota bacterium]